MKNKIILGMFLISVLMMSGIVSAELTMDDIYSNFEKDGLSIQIGIPDMEGSLDYVDEWDVNSDGFINGIEVCNKIDRRCIFSSSSGEWNFNLGSCYDRTAVSDIVDKLSFFQVLCMGNRDTYDDLNSCIDSDGGKNYNKKGIRISAEGIEEEDYCIDGERVMEFYCYNRSSSDYSDWKIYECPNGCENGACKTEFQEAEKPKITTAKPEATQGFFSRIFTRATGKVVSLFS